MRRRTGWLLVALGFGACGEHGASTGSGPAGDAGLDDARDVVAVDTTSDGDAPHLHDATDDPRPDTPQDAVGDPVPDAPRDAPAAEADAPGPPASPEEPIRIVFKIHIEPQGPVEAYRARRDTIEAVRALAEARGVPLTLHGNGEFWQHALEQGDRSLVERWLTAGHDVGVHQHGIHEDPDDSHAWRDLGPDPTRDAVLEAWRDHHRHLAALLPALAIRQATPWNTFDDGFTALMVAHGYEILGGGRHEIAHAWLGHPPFHPFRIGARYLEEDLTSPVLMVHHGAQFGEAAPHGPPGARPFQDHRPERLRVEFLQIFVAWLHAERSGDPADRVWLFGFLTHDNQTPPARRTAIAEFLDWLTAHFGRTSARGNPILRFSSFSEVASAYYRWEAAHPGTSSTHVPTPELLDPRDATRVTREERRRIYPYPYWGLAEELRATESRVADWAGRITDLEAAGVFCHRLLVGSRADPSAREQRWLLFREQDGEAVVDVSAVTGRARVRAFDPVTGAVTQLDARSVRVAGEPVLLAP